MCSTCFSQTYYLQLLLKKLTVKCPTAKCLYDKKALGEIFVMRSILTAKNPKAKKPTAKCPTAKSPRALLDTGIETGSTVQSPQTYGLQMLADFEIIPSSLTSLTSIHLLWLLLFTFPTTIFT